MFFTSMLAMLEKTIHVDNETQSWFHMPTLWKL